MGALLALIPAIGWGIQPLIVRKVGGSVANSVLGTGLGAVVIGLIIQCIYGSAGGTTFLISFVSGLLWMMGQAGQYFAFTKIGVTRANPISTGLQIVGTSVIGVLIFGEWSGTVSKLLGLLAILLIIVGVALTAVTDRHDSQNSHMLGRTLMVLVPTTIGYWAYSALPKVVSAASLQIFFPQMLGIAVGAVLYALVTTKGHALIEKQSWQSLIVGLIFGASSLAYIFAAKSVGVASAFVITQLNVVVATLGAMIVLKETKTSRELRATIVGLILIVGGSVITAFI